MQKEKKLEEKPECKTCGLAHYGEQNPEHPFDLEECLKNALGDIGQLASRKRELLREIALLRKEIEEKDDLIDDLEATVRTLTHEVNE